MRTTKNLAYTIALLLLVHPLWGIVKYEEGSLQINGIQLYQDSDNENAYYYVPPYPRLSVDNNGNFEFLCIKYVSPDGKKASGGIFHALVQFTLSPKEFKALEAALKEKFPKAVLMGVVPMKDAVHDGENGISSFSIVSSVLNPAADNPFQTSVVTSGRAPFFPGSKAAVAARLDADGATLLWDSFQANTSDVSVVVEGYFEALVKGYQATVNADLEVVYDHFSSFKNKQQGFSRDQARKVVDSMYQNGTINIDVIDRSQGLDIDTKAAQEIVDLVTEKVIDMMFNVKSGWAKMPETTTAVEPTDLKERYENGDFVSFFFGDGPQAYIPDNQYLLKEKKEIRNFKFFLNLTQSTTIKVPVYSAGNISGFYDEFKDDDKYFRVVNLEDPVFQNRELHFQIDGNFVDAYNDIINFASINVRKYYPDNTPYTGDLIFTKSDIQEGKSLKSIHYPRLGQSGVEWKNYEYQIAWSLIGFDSTLFTPAKEYTKADLSVISMKPPFDKQVIEIDADRALFKELGIRSARIRFATVLVGKPQNQKMVVLRHDDDSDTKEIAIYHDEDQPIVYQVSWYSNSGKKEEELKILEGGYLFLVPPDKEDFQNK